MFDWSNILDRFTSVDEWLGKIYRALSDITVGAVGLGGAVIEDAYWSKSFSLSAGANPIYIFDPQMSISNNPSKTPFVPTYVELTTSSEITVRLNRDAYSLITIPAGGAIYIGKYRPFKVHRIFVYNTNATNLTILVQGKEE